MSAKFFRRGQREYYMVTPEKVLRIINKLYVSEVSITHHGEDKNNNVFLDFMQSAAEEGKEITRDEFKKQFEEASRLIVLEE